MKTTKTTFLASNKLNEVKNKLEDTDVQNQLVSVLEKINLRGTFEINQDVNDLADYNSSEKLEFKHKKDIQDLLSLNKYKNSMFKSPIFFISPGERRGLSNLSLNIFDTSNKFKDLLLFFKQQGIIETPEINIYLKDHGDRSSRNVDYDISKSLSVIKKILSYDFDYKIKIFSTESLYSTYISDIFTEDELEKMSVSVFSDNEFEYPKDREVSDFSVKKLLYLNSHELSWISEILK